MLNLLNKEIQEDKDLEMFVDPDYRTDHSPSGWTNSDVWKHYLKALRYDFIPPDSQLPFYAEENRIYVFCDCYNVHCKNDTKNYHNSKRMYRQISIS